MADERADERAEARFAAALRSAAAPVPENLAARPGVPPTGRFAIHRGHHRAGLVRALAARFPATEAVVGTDFFTAMAEAFAAQHPPRSSVLHEYGDGLAAFIAGFAPASGLPYLPDVARLEAARSAAYHAADADPLGAVDFAALPGEALSGLRLGLHPSAAMIASPHPIVTIWAMNAGAAPLAPIERWGPEAALVIRPRMEVHVHRLSSGVVAFIAALGQGLALGAAIEAVVAMEPAVDVPPTLAFAIGAGLFVGFR